MFSLPVQRPRWNLLSFAVVALLVLSLGIACGSDGNEDGDDAGSGNTSGAVTATRSTSGTTGGTSNTPATGSGTSSTPATGSGSTGAMSSAELGAIGACFMEGTSEDVLTDLRDGETGSAEEMYRACLEESLPENLVDQLDPIIEQAADCGTTAAEGLSDEELADPGVAEIVTVATLDCVSDELGIDLTGSM